MILGLGIYPTHPLSERFSQRTFLPFAVLLPGKSLREERVDISLELLSLERGAICQDNSGSATVGLTTAVNYSRSIGGFSLEHS